MVSESRPVFSLLQRGREEEIRGEYGSTIIIIIIIIIIST